jgi:hypothetical protein
MNHRRFRLRSAWPILFGLFFGVLAIWQHQAIQDWIDLYHYVPPQPVSQLADQIDLTPKARRYFYINHPAIEDRAAFNQACTNSSEQTIVLGCYHSVDQGIYIFDVTDGRLAGVEQVTAAHEMLHAAYDHLSNSERNYVDGLLQNYYEHDLQDARIKAVIASYKTSEPNAVVNEMHSVFGTEVGNLPPALENYYTQYFTNRQKIVDYANDYQAEFTSRQNQVTADDQQLQAMKQQIDSDKTELTTEETQITSERTALDSERSAGEIDAYNNEVPLYNSRIDSYNDLIDTIKSLIASYNQLVGERNDIALQVTDLAQAIDSNVQPINQ